MQHKETFDTRDSYALEILEAAQKTKHLKAQKQDAATKEKLMGFMRADVSDSEIGIIPEGYAAISYLTFFLFGPMIAGTLFLYFYVSGGDAATYQSLEQNALLTWVIGYEILATLVLLLIFKKLLAFMLKKAP